MKILILAFVLCTSGISISAKTSIKCPFDWFRFNSSCYKKYDAETYSSAMNKCFKLYSNQPIKRPYLVNIESQEEMKFVMSLMINKDIKEMYIGANNIVKRSTNLLWETLSPVMKEVDRSFLCSDVKVDNKSFYCGFIKNMFNSDFYPNKSIHADLEFEENLKKDILKPIDPDIAGSFCVNVSDCFIRLPYLCEVNCTNQEKVCTRWADEYEILNGTFTTKRPTTTTTKALTTKSTSTTTTTLYDPCAYKHDNCTNNSTCYYNADSPTKYSCLCQEGFEGEHCERDERPCQPHRNRCKNNSTCFQSGKFYNCTCESGFEGFHCELNIDDCDGHKCQNGGQCEDLVNSYRCICLSYYYGDYCEFKQQELVIKENVSRSFSVFAIFFIIFTYGFFMSLDALRFVFRIEPEGLSQERQLVRKRKLMRKIMNDMRDKSKRKKYRKIIYSNYRAKDSFIYKFEKTFGISYDRDLKFIDEDPIIDCSKNVPIGLD